MKIFLQRMVKYVVVFMALLCQLQSRAQDSGARGQSDTLVPTVAPAKPVVRRPVPVQNDSVRRVVRDSSRRVQAPVRSIVDSTAAADSVVSDSVFVPRQELRPTVSLFKGFADTAVFSFSPVFSFTEPMRYSITVKKWEGKEALFYSIIALLVFFALIKNAFNRYVHDLFKIYFRTTVKQKQTKEQLQQNTLPSLLFNAFFVLSIGLFLALLLQHFGLALEWNFWILYLYCVLALIAVYLVKFISLKMFGWILQVPDSIDSYIFIVFATNKIIGIALLPFLVVLAFTGGVVNEAAMSLSIMVIFGLLVYRFFLSYISVRRQIQLDVLHFLLYLVAFEIVPLLLINKVLFTFLGETS